MFHDRSVCRARGDIDWDSLCAGLTEECEDTYGCVLEHGECNADKEADWLDCRPKDVPCSDPEFPVCVEVTILPHEGMSLNAAGTMYAMQGSSDMSASDLEIKKMSGIMELFVAREMANGGSLSEEQEEQVRKDWDRAHEGNNDPVVCVPITRKLELNTENIKQRFEEGHLWRTNCVYNPQASGCSLPPLRLSDLIEHFNLQEMSNQLRVHAPMSFISQSQPEVQLRWGNTVAMTANGLGQDELAHKEWFNAKVDVAAMFPFAQYTQPGELEFELRSRLNVQRLCASYRRRDKGELRAHPAGDVAGDVPKPELQLQTPHDITDTARQTSIQGFLRGPFRNFETPVRKSAPCMKRIRFGWRRRLTHTFRGTRAAGTTKLSRARRSSTTRPCMCITAQNTWICTHIATTIT